VRFGGRGYALLIGNGASGLASSEQVVQSEAGISLLGAQYTIRPGIRPGRSAFWSAARTPRG
jgi:hypothetical protein